MVYTQGLAFTISTLRHTPNQINCPFWIARYPSTKGMSIVDEPNSAKKPVIQHPLYGWQYSSAFTCSGLNNSTDANLFYIELDKGDGIENNPAPTATPVKDNAWKGNEEYYLDNDDVRKWQHAMTSDLTQTSLRKMASLEPIHRDLLKITICGAVRGITARQH